MKHVWFETIIDSPNIGERHVYERRIGERKIGKQKIRERRTIV